jgi:hypothetical protein
MMAAIAILAVGLSASLALGSRRARNDPDVRVLAMALALILTLAADRALFGRRHRAFWLGFTAAGWLCAATVLSFHQDTRRYLRRYGPPLLREHELYQRQLVWARMGRAPAPPRPPEWHLLASLLAESGLGLALGVLAASAGGLLASSVLLIARRAARLAQRLDLPDPVLHQSRPVVRRERSPRSHLTFGG